MALGATFKLVGEGQQLFETAPSVEERSESIDKKTMEYPAGSPRKADS